MHIIFALSCNRFQGASRASARARAQSYGVGSLSSKQEVALLLSLQLLLLLLLLCARCERSSERASICLGLASKRAELARAIDLVACAASLKTSSEPNLTVLGR